jgi:hypothetical protein
MKTVTGPHRSREDHLQGLLQRKRFLCSREPAWERRGPRDREIAALNRQIDHLLDQCGSGDARTVPGISMDIPFIIPPRTRPQCLRVSAVGMRVVRGLPMAALADQETCG